MVDRQENKTFYDFYLSEELQKALSTIGYSTPTPVQAASIPLIMAGIDLIVQSQTGTGKTAAFGIPVVEMLEPDPGTIEVLVLAPTRELAKQVSDEFAQLTKYRPISSTSIYGGAAYGPQIEALQKAQIVCATPGRLLDMLKQKHMTLDKLRFFILDEADEMLSMGFERDLKAILEFLPEERQSLLFSATVTNDVHALAKKMLFYPEFLSFSSDSVVNKDVDHACYPVSGISRLRDLIKVLEFEEPDHAIIFANTKDDTFLVNSYLQRHGYASEVLNGDMAQKDREKTLAKLKDGQINYLVATDVAARGIDITELSHVINYVLPDSPEVYVHRTGRTGRAGKKGVALSLVSPAEMAAFILTEKRLGMEISRRAIPTTREISKAKQARRTQDVITHVDLFQDASTSTFEALAASLVADSEQDALQAMLAKLLTIASKTLNAQGKLKKLRAAAAPAPAPTPAPTEVQEAPAPKEEAKEEAPAKEEQTEEAPAAQKEEPTQKRSRRGRSSSKLEDSSSKKDTPTEEKTSDSGEEKDDKNDKPERPEKESRSRGSRRRRSSSRNSSSQEKAPQKQPQKPKVEHEMSKMWLSLGKNGFKEQDEVLEFLVYNSGMDEDDFGEIRLERTRTFVDVRRDYIQDVIIAVNDLEVDGNTLSAKHARR